jgi:hypothetical protein
VADDDDTVVVRPLAVGTKNQPPRAAIGAHKTTAKKPALHPISTVTDALEMG